MTPPLVRPIPAGLTLAEKVLLLAMAVSLVHHVDHVLRRDHSGWPFTPDVTPFTYSLVAYPVLIAVLLLRSRPWLRVGRCLVCPATSPERSEGLRGVALCEILDAEFGERPNYAILPARGDLRAGALRPSSFPARRAGRGALRSKGRRDRRPAGPSRRPRGGPAGAV
ncbi:MAG: hypothetical protein AVDCRST_MAG01-01-4397 [uncultured Rubrobacteraceae bacterium]|uniref:Uncharacterized protein n=1 Tax=uncultured Rubrobacteraceae bacterium TaxID=349277 RepID=A0A6J4QMH4_9ACTN|nr:MAG: hypothetical protein AVDCRST_MAG01-01-4397 [uncultured Rubrobacteraceae bacterium]